MLFIRFMVALVKECFNSFIMDNDSLLSLKWEEMKFNDDFDINLDELFSFNQIKT